MRARTDGDDGAGEDVGMAHAVFAFVRFSLPHITGCKRFSKEPGRYAPHADGAEAVGASQVLALDVVGVAPAVEVPGPVDEAAVPVYHRAHALLFCFVLFCCIVLCCLCVYLSDCPVCLCARVCVRARHTVSRALWRHVFLVFRYSRSHDLRARSSAASPGGICWDI